MSSWEQRMSNKAKARREARELFDMMEARLDYFAQHPESLMCFPTTYPPDHCDECHQWRRDGVWGYRWFTVCDIYECPHAHHDDEVGIAGSIA